MPTFVAVKVGLTTLGAFFLLAHVRFRIARRALLLVLVLYVLLMSYHVWLRSQLT